MHNKSDGNLFKIFKNFKKNGNGYLRESDGLRSQ